MSASELLHETEIIARLMREKRIDRNVSLSIEEIPDEIGSYWVYDGLICMGGGMTRRMRNAVIALSRRGLKRPIFIWSPDSDGSVALWLDGQIRCSICSAVTKIEELERHEQDAHECGEGSDGY